MSDWAAKVLADVPRHNAQDAKNMTGYTSAVWLHEDAVVDAIAKLAEGDGLVERLQGEMQLYAEWRGKAEAAEAERDALRAKVARLEGVLRKIADMLDYRLPRPQEVARAALNDENKEKP